MTAIGKNKFLQFPVFLLSAVLNDAKIIECNNSNVTQGELRTNKKLQEEVQSTKYTVLVRTYYVLCYEVMIRINMIQTLIIFVYTILTKFYPQ